MKRLFAMLLATLLVLSLCACGGETTEEPKTDTPVETKEYPLDKYDLGAYMIPYWSGDTVYQESVMLLEDAEGNLPQIPLLYEAKEILSVRSSSLQIEYQAGKDYQLVDGKLVIPEGSAIPTVSHDFYYPAEESDTAMELNENYGEGFIYFKEGTAMHDRQIAVTYTHEGTFDGAVPACKAEQLPKTAEKLKNGGELKVAFYGDSISAGRNSTGREGGKPGAPIWPLMFASYVKENYPDTAVLYENPSVPGKKSAWGAENAEEFVGYGPDLCIIGFGMNDGSSKVDPEAFKANIQTIMDAARKGNPNCEFVLLSTMLPNPEADNFLGKQEEYLPVLESMETEGVVVADMTTYHKSLLAHKRYYDMTGNNVNHPNDFLARAYAQLLWQTVVGY